MSQGLTWIAARRMPLVALVALLALAVGMFAVIQSASAAAGLVVSIDDSDGVVNPGSSVDASVQVVGDADGADYTVSFAIASSGVVLHNPDSFAAVDPGDKVTDAAKTAIGEVLIPKTASGDYTISARVTRGTAGADGYVVLEDTLTFTVGEAGAGVASASISVGKAGHATAKGAASDSDSAAAGTIPSGAAAYADCANDNDDDTEPGDGQGDTDLINSGCIALTVSIQNALGNAANPGDVSAIHIFAPLATIIADNDDDNLNQGNDNFNGTAQLPGDRNSVKIFVARGDAGPVSVSAIIIGTAGSTTSEVTELTFTGSADTISVGEPDSALAQTGTAAVVASLGDDDAVGGTGDDADVEKVDSSGEARIEVTAVDKSGNVAALPFGDISVEVVDADDDLATKVIPTPTQQVNAKGVENPNAVRITLRGEEADAGEYTVKVTFGDNDPETATIVVAGKVASVALESSHDSVGLGNIITVTATVTDEDGNLSPDVGEVTFQAVGALKLNALGKDAEGGSVSIAINDGAAEARFVVVDGSGTATIIASTGGVDGVTSVSTEAAAVVDEPDPEPVDGLSRTQLNNFASWSGEGSVSASELLAGIAGATGVLYYDGDSWQRYGVTDGQVIPGSRDFIVRDGDVLWISG